MKLSKIFKIAGKVLKDNSSAILMVTGVIGYGVSCYFAAKGYESYKAEEEVKKEELEVEDLPVKEKAKLIAKHGWKTGLAFASSTFCVGYSRNIVLKRNAVLAVALKGTETALLDFQQETKKIVGEDTYKQIEEKVVEKKMAEEDVPEFDKKSYLDDAKELFYDGTYGGYFYATELEVYKAFEETRSDIEWAKHTSLGEGYKEAVPLGDLYYRLHGEPIGIGDDYGYYIDEYRSNRLDYMLSGDYKKAPNGKPAIVIIYDKAKPL